jgi:vancomycin aglycone glucosyltransferase
MKIVTAVNHAVVFPACAAVVHHGGSGTTAAGVRAGVPTLVLWLEVHDQPIWGDAVRRLGVGAGQSFSSTTQDSLVAALHSILAPHCRSRAQEVSAQLTPPARSAARAVDLLEAAHRQNA